MNHHVLSNQEEEWSKDVIGPESAALLGGRTPLQIACARDDNYRVSISLFLLQTERAEQLYNQLTHKGVN